MDSFSDKDAEIARKINSEFFQRLSEEGQKPVAEVIGVSEATISRVKQHSEDTIKALRVLGYKVVSREYKCYRPEVIQPYIDLAKQHMAQIESADQLEWEE